MLDKNWKQYLTILKNIYMNIYEKYIFFSQSTLLKFTAMGTHLTHALLYLYMKKAQTRK